MAYTRRRYRRRYRKRLSDRTVFSKTSAKSQAKQIAVLRNRINKVSKANRLEIKNSQETFTETFSNSSLATVYAFWKIPDSFIKNNWTKLKGFTLNGILEYGDNREAYPGQEMTRSGSARILIYQNLQARNQTSSPSFIVDIANTGTDYELNTTRPLKDGVTSYVKILADRTYLLSDQEPQKRVHISIRKLLNFHKEEGDTYPRGAIFVAVITSGLHWTSGGYTETIKASLNSKLLYIED